MRCNGRLCTMHVIGGEGESERRDTRQRAWVMCVGISSFETLSFYFSSILDIWQFMVFYLHHAFIVCGHCNRFLRISIVLLNTDSHKRILFQNRQIRMCWVLCYYIALVYKSSSMSITLLLHKNQKHCGLCEI